MPLTVKHDPHCVSQTDKLPFQFFFGGWSQLAIELDNLCGVDNLYSAREKLSYHVPGSVYGKALTRQLYSTPIHGCLRT